MSSKAYADRLAAALQGTGLVEPVQSTYAENRINVLCRVNKGAESQWVTLLQNMLLATEAEAKQAHAWQSHFCRHYFLKGDGADRKIVFGWNVSIQSASMGTSLDYLIRVIKGEAPGARSKALAGELTEMPLAGASSERGKYKNNKGAFTIGGSDDFKPTFRR